MKKRRIAIVAACPFPTSQGSQVLIHDTARLLARRGHWASIVAYPYGEAGRATSAPVHRPPALVPYRRLRAGPSARKPLVDMLLRRTLHRVVEREETEIIHAHNLEAAWVAAPVARRARIPLVFHAHNLLSEEIESFLRLPVLRNAVKAVAKRIDRRIPRLADAVITVSPFLKERLAALGIPRGRIRFVPPSIDPRWERLVPRPPDLLFNLPEEMVLYLGNLDSYQRFDLLFSAFAGVRRERPRARLLLAGPNDPGSLEPLPEGVHAAEVRSPTEMKWLLGRTRLAVSTRTSPYGFPIKLLAYMQAACPIVTFLDAGGTLRHLESAYVAKEGNPEDFASGILLLLDERESAERLGRNARKAALALHGPDRVAQGIEAVYDALRRPGAGSCPL